LAIQSLLSPVNEIQNIIKKDILPFFDVVDPVLDSPAICRDPEDDKFISCAISGSADLLVTGDKDLLDLGHVKVVKIITPSRFLELLD